MIEIAICLGVIGFALVAIIGILPTGMNVQKENRQETLVNQDASIFLEAIRNGAQGVDDLTNYVGAITNYWTFWNGSAAQSQHSDGYTYTNSDATGIPLFPILSGNRIIGLLSTPKYTDVVTNGTSYQFRSNYVVAYVRAISGGAAEKYPQTNRNVTDGTFSYRLVSEVIPYTYYDPNWTNWTDPALYTPTTNAVEIAARQQRAAVALNQQNNLYDLRLLFRWPLFLNGNTGAGRQAFRTITGGHLMQTNDGGYPAGISNLFLFQPRTYQKAT